MLPLLLSTVLASSPLIVAHRGASHDAPENTLPAFELAWKQGADAIEGDFHLTADGKILCIHDADTQRVSGTKLVVKDSTLTRLLELDAGAWFAPEWRGTRFPTFAQVAATVPAGKKFYIELKSGPEIVPPLLEELAKTKLAREQIVIISFHAEVIRVLKQQQPALTAYWLSSFRKSSPLDPSAATVLETLRRIRADGFSSRADERLTPAYLEPLRAAGFSYHCWTVDDPALALRFQQIGAQSITTNRPAFLRQHMEDPATR